MNLGPIQTSVNRINSALRVYLNENQLFYIGIINTYMLLTAGSIITYTLSIASIKGELAVISSSLFGIAAITIFYHFQKLFGPSYNSGQEDILVFVLIGSLFISSLPIINISILGLTGIYSFLFFIIGLFTISSVVILLIHLTVIEPMTPKNS